MTDKTDPRLDALQDVAYEEMDACFCGKCGAAERWLAQLDDADRAAGVVRVDTNNEALVERLYVATETLWETDGFGPDDMIRAVLAALRETAQ